MERGMQAMRYADETDEDPGRAWIESGEHRIRGQAHRIEDLTRWFEVLATEVDRARAAGGGEIRVRTRSGSGLVHVAARGIAWVWAGSGETRLSAVISARAGLSIATLQGAYRRCRARGANFAESLVAEGLADRETVRAALVEHNARQLARLDAEHPELLETFPTTRAYASELVFTLEELRAEMARLLPSTPGRSTTATSDHDTDQRRRPDMANIKQSLDEVMQIEGAIAAALVDWESGLTLGTVGGGGLDIELAASGNTSVVKAKMAVMRALGIAGGIEDILITLQSQYHLIRPLTKSPQLFLYLAIDKQRGNLGLARHRLRQIEEALVL